MKINYFPATDTLHIEPGLSAVNETRDLDEDTVAEFDVEGQPSALNPEHASIRAGIPHFWFEQVRA